MSMPNPLNRTCREVTRLVLQARDERPLGLGDRLGVVLHLALCGMCRRFRRQVAFMDVAIDRWKSYRNDD